jgi:hypothetical protein
MRSLFFPTAGVLAVSCLLSAGTGIYAAESKENLATPAAYSMDDHTLHVFYRNSDGKIVELYTKEGDPKGWFSHDLSTEASAPQAASKPAAFLTADKAQHVVYRGSDDQIHELFRSDARGKWGHANLSGDSKAPKGAGAPVGYIVPDDKSLHVVYRSDGGDVVELFREAGGKGWRFADLSKGTEAAKATGDPAAFMGEGGKTQHVVYRGTDDQVHELFYSKGLGKWGHANISAAAKAPKAAGNPRGYTMSSDKSVHVVYRTEGGDICELSRANEGKDWNAVDLTKSTDAAKAAGRPYGFVETDGKTQHVAYRGMDEQIHELFRDMARNKWEHANVSGGIKEAPKAGGNPVGFETKDDKTFHLYFATTDGAICELYRQAGQGKTWNCVNLTIAAKGRPSGK